jgi:nitrilase
MSDGLSIPDPVGSRFVAAVVQDAPAVLDREGSISKVQALTAEAAHGGARLVVFPEAFVSAYPKGLDFGARVGTRTAEGRDAFRRYFESALEIPSSGAAGLAAAARDNGVHLVVGVVERAGGTLYCTALIFGPDGALLGKHRKVMPTAAERLVWGFGDGSTLPVVTTEHGKLGAVICWENYMPLLRTAMYAQGVELYCAPTVDDRETWLPTMRHVALEGRCFVLSACQYLRRADCPADYGSEYASDATMIRGGSVIVGPLGEVLAGPLFDEAGILYAEIDPRAIARGKFDLDVVGHYARPDIFTLHVKTTAQNPVVRDDIP